MPYYVLEGEAEHPVFPIEKTPNLPGGPWYRGQILSIKVPDPLVCYLKRVDPAELKQLEDEDMLEPDDLPENWNLETLYDSIAYPVIRKDLYAALQKAGVDNLQVFPALLIDPNSGKEHSDYLALNVVGLVSAADLKQSVLMHPGASPTLLDTDFESLVIDESKAGGVDMFRLAESCSAICVSEHVKNVIEAEKIPGLIFYADGEWSG